MIKDQKIRIRMKAYDHKLLDQGSNTAADHDQQVLCIEVTAQGQKVP